MIIISKSNIFFELFLEKMLIGIQKKKDNCFKTFG